MTTRTPDQDSVKTKGHAALLRDAMAGQVSRRELVRRGAALGLGAPAIAGLLLNDGARKATAQGSPSALAGQTFDMKILGIEGWPPSQLGVDLATELFKPYAQETLGYTVNFSFEGAPFDQLFQRAATSLESQSNEYNIIISDSQWIGALAEREWILPLNPIIAENPELDIEFEPTARAGYQVYPDGSDQLWGFPQEGDTIALFVRQDLFSRQAERDAFQAQAGFALPQTYEDWEQIDIDQYAQLCAFFTRPDQGLYGMSTQWSKVYDYITCYLYPFMFSTGGEVWDPATGQVEGILNSETNAAAMEKNKSFLDYAPDGATNHGIPQLVDVFTAGTIATCLQWSALGPQMMNAAGDAAKAITPEDVLIVPPPGFRQADGTLRRVYTLGGQPWVINAYNTPEQTQVAIDFMKFWYLPETQAEFAARGGNPCTVAALSAPGFEEQQPHFRAYKYMIQNDRSRDFWHSPSYAEMLLAQQEAFSAYVTDVVTDPMQALTYAACTQQQILFDAEESEIEPSDACADATL
jgi:multiple sugar transport system substrate-binding protein